MNFKVTFNREGDILNITRNFGLEKLKPYQKILDVKDIDLNKVDQYVENKTKDFKCLVLSVIKHKVDKDWVSVFYYNQSNPIDMYMIHRDLEKCNKSGLGEFKIQRDIREPKNK